MLYPGDGCPYEEYLYDGNDNLTGFRNANGHVTEYLYDALDRLESEIRPGAVTTGLDHDAADNLTQVTDPGANTTVYTHDDLGRTTQVDSPDAGITVYGHDPAGNVTARTDANGVTVTYGYDALNRLIMASFPGGGEDFAFGYDAGAFGKGHLTSATDAAGSTTFTHDALGRVTEEARVTDGVSYATGYAYSATTGDLVGMTYPTGLALTFQPDAVGRISAVTAGGRTIAGNIVYLPFGPVETMDLGAVSVTRIHDTRYQVTGIQAGTALNYTYTRDGMGNVDTLEGLILPEPAPGTTDYSHIANRLVSSTGAEPAAYTYDNAGNITSDGARDFVYNQNNRLVRVEAGGTVIAEYAYDGFERRVKKVAGGVTTHYHYDLNGWLISETDGAGNPIRDYVYIDGEPVAMQVYGAGAGWYWFLNDHLGTPQKLVDSAGAVVWQAAYMPFGDARVLTADVENNLRFPGQYYDAETGLHYNWHRYYDPETGRYLRPDPIGLAGGINLFAYVLNNPMNMVDIDGLVGYWIVNLVKKVSTKEVTQYIKRLTKKQAVDARKKGLNVESDTRQAARSIEHAARGGNPKSIKRHPGHALKDEKGNIIYGPDGKPLKGKSHYQTDGVSGHSFWRGAVFFMATLLDPFGAEPSADGSLPDNWPESKGPCK